MIAWCTALLWAIHPVLTQSVNYTTQRSVLLCGLFYVWGLWAFLEWMQRDDEGGVSYLVIAILMGVLSVLSKEIGATFVLAALFVHWLSPRTEVTQRQYTLAGLGCLALFGLVSFYLLGGVDGTVQRLSGLFSSERVGGRRFTSWQRVMTEWRVMLFYLSLVLYPRLHRLNIEHEIDLSTGLLTPYTTGLSLVTILGLIVLAYRWRRRYPIMTFGVVWFFLHLSITSTVIPLELVFEHRVYLAAVGPVLVLVDLGYRRWPLATFVQVGVLVALVMGLGWITYQRNQVWQSTRSLYRDAVRKAPEKPRNHGNLGVAYAREARHVLKTEQDLEKAFTLMDRALRQHYRTMSLSKKQDRPIDRQFTSNIEPLLRDMTAIWSKLKRRTEDPEWTRRLLQWHKRFLFSMPPSYFRDRDAVRRQLSELRVFLAGVYLRQNEPGRARKLLKTVMDPDPARVDNVLSQVEDPHVKRRLRELIHTIRTRRRDGDEGLDHR